ncbi:MAG: SDR family NAD(P)-dependent oxidoreductase [Patescibacteria group bacterium]|jgi:NAD(P)-dependent dehydrogenase (short-subunit alcohol dehydrogenase family)
MKLTGKTAIVTGAKQGIGKGIALALAQAGAKVVVSDLDLTESQLVVDEIIAQGGEALAVKCDVTKKEEIEAMITQTKETFQSVDILVNNAGVFPAKSFTEMSEADWDWVMNINVKGVFLCTQEALKVMPDGGRIINISSIAGTIGFPGLTHYCASKGAVNSLARALALELAPRQITVNNVAPGAIETPGASGAQDEQTKQQTTLAIPLARQGEPADIAQAVVYLASPGANYVTGQTITVDGGWTVQ